MTQAYKCDGCGELAEGVPFSVNRWEDGESWDGDFCPDCFHNGIEEEDLNHDVHGGE